MRRASTLPFASFEKLYSDAGQNKNEARGAAADLRVLTLSPNLLAEFFECPDLRKLADDRGGVFAIGIADVATIDDPVGREILGLASDVRDRRDVVADRVLITVRPLHVDRRSFGPFLCGIFD